MILKIFTFNVKINTDISYLPKLSELSNKPVGEFKDLYVMSEVFHEKNKKNLFCKNILININEKFTVDKNYYIDVNSLKESFYLNIKEEPESNNIYILNFVLPKLGKDDNLTNEKLLKFLNFFSHDNSRLYLCPNLFMYTKLKESIFNKTSLDNLANDNKLHLNGNDNSDLNYYTKKILLKKRNLIRRVILK